MYSRALSYDMNSSSHELWTLSEQVQSVRLRYGLSLHFHWLVSPFLLMPSAHHMALGSLELRELACHSITDSFIACLSFLSHINSMSSFNISSFNSMSIIYSYYRTSASTCCGKTTPRTTCRWTRGARRRSRATRTSRRWWTLASRAAMPRRAAPRCPRTLRSASALARTRSPSDPAHPIAGSTASRSHSAAYCMHVTIRLCLCFFLFVRRQRCCCCLKNDGGEDSALWGEGARSLWCANAKACWSICGD